MKRVIERKPIAEIKANHLQQEIHHSLFNGTARPWPDGTPRWKPRPMVATQGATNRADS
jgi:hypothetical protein